MFIHNYEVTEYHGGSLKIEARIKINSNRNSKIKIKEAIKKEINYGLFKKQIYKNLNLKLQNKKKSLLKKINFYKKRNYKIIGIGAAAKANTFLCYFDLNNKLIDFITDSSKFKIGKFTPKTRIPIYSDERINKFREKIVAIILSWNISNMLKVKLKKINRNLKFIKL